ncbi:MAG: serine hydrolase domain-containing protein, partial [Alteraurantiacibacter sp.]
TEQVVQNGMAATDAEGLAFAIVRNGEVVKIEAFGVRNAEREPLTVDTVMYGASLTKTAFAYLILQLHDEGLLDLDQTIDTLLPRPLPTYEGFRRTHAPWTDLAGDDRWKFITPRMLLSHSGGFRNFFFITPEGEFSMVPAGGSIFTSIRAHDTFIQVTVSSCCSSCSNRVLDWMSAKKCASGSSARWA